MYATIFLLAVIGIAQVLERGFRIPVISNCSNTLVNTVGSSYPKLMLVILLSTAALYGVGLAVLGPILGVHAAACQIGALCLLIFLAGLAKSVFGVGQDSVSLAASVVGKNIAGARSTSVPSSVFFLTGLFGAAAFLLFFYHPGDVLLTL